MIPVLEWFASCQIITKNSVADAYGINAEQLKDSDCSAIALMLKAADFGIQALQVRDVDPLLKLSKGAISYLNVEMVHTVQDDAGETNTYVLNMAEESDGTNSYFKLIGVIKKALE